MNIFEPMYAKQILNAIKRMQDKGIITLEEIVKKLEEDAGR